MSEESLSVNKLNRREFMALTGSALVSGSLLAACGGTSTATTGSSGNVEFWSEFSAAPDGPAMDSIVAAFNKAHPNLLIKHVKFENTPYKAALKAAFASGAVPDIAEDDVGGWISPFADAGQLTDITDLIDQAQEKFDPAAISAVTYKGRKWAAPFGKVPGNLIWYNKDILAQHKIDPTTLTTWSAFTAVLEKLKQAGVTPIALGNKEEWNGAHWLGHLYVRTMGVEKADELFRRGLEPGFKSPLKFTDPMAVKPWELLKDLQTKGYFSAGILSDDFPTAFAKFFRGDGAFFQTGGWLLASQKSQAPNFKMGFMLPPAIDGIPESDATDYVFNCIGMRIPKQAKHPEGAREWVKWWLTSEEPHKLWSEQDLGQLPAMKGVTLENMPSEIQGFLDLQNKAHHSTLFIDSLINGDLSQQILWKASNGLFSGALTPSQAAENAEQLVSHWQQQHPS